MKYLDGNYYVEVKDHRYSIHPTEKVNIRLRYPPKFLRTQYQVQNGTQIRKNQKVIQKDNNQLEDKIYPKKNNHFHNNQNLNHQIVLIVSAIIG